jgi:hypothetical protein
MRYKTLTLPLSETFIHVKHAPNEKIVNELLIIQSGSPPQQIRLKSREIMSLKELISNYEFDGHFVIDTEIE